MSAQRTGSGAGPAADPVADLVRRLGGAARQVDGTTCGSAVLGMLAAAGDPVLGAWLVDGPGRAVDRFGHLQRTVQRRTNGHALGFLPWPSALGTPPWGAARVARYGDRRYTHRAVGGLPARDREALLDVATRAAASGIPVPLYTGDAVPRHVVLLTAVDGPRAQVYEPSSGEMHQVATSGIRAGSAPRRGAALRRAFGGWPRVWWVLLPRP